MSALDLLPSGVSPDDMRETGLARYPETSPFPIRDFQESVLDPQNEFMSRSMQMQQPPQMQMPQQMPQQSRSNHSRCSPHYRRLPGAATPCTHR
jgi:hypothetical protein